MEQVDFAKIISAAAVSTLGVLSLIVVALGVIAFYFFKGSGDKVKLGVWLTMLLAAALFAAAVISQSAPQRDDRRVPDPDPDPTATPLVVPSDRPTAPPTSQPTPTHSATPEATDPEPIDLSGRWHDSDGYFYDIQVNGTAIAYQQWLNGQYVGYGRGTVSGRTLNYRYVSAQAGQGGCKGIVATDAQSISGSCTADGGGTWTFSVER